MIKEEIDQVAFRTAKIIANLSAYSSGTWRNRKELNDQIEELLSILSVSEAEKERTLELPRIVEKSMKGKEALNPKEKRKSDEMFNLEERD